MGEAVKQMTVKLVASIIFRDRPRLERAEKCLKRIYGAMETLELESPFDYTDYYSSEFGSPLYRKIFCFRKPVGPERLADIKLVTNRLECKMKVEGKRTVNIDPGYVTDAKLVLLTTKDYTHRVYIGSRIFAESTLHYRDGSFRPWPWTYPDYASDAIVGYFNKVRKLYLHDVRGRRIKEKKLQRRIWKVRDVTQK